MQQHSTDFQSDSPSRSPRPDLDGGHAGHRAAICSLVDLIHEKSVAECEASLHTRGLSFERLVSLVCH